MADSSSQFPLKRRTYSIYNQRYGVEVCDKSLDVALMCMALGEVAQANRIVDLLYDYDAFEYTHPKTKNCMHFAWNASNLWPKVYTDPQEGKVIPTKTGEDHGASLLPKLESDARDEWARLLEKDVDAELTFEDFTKARELASRDERDERHAALALGVEIALRLGLDDVAGELVREHLVKRLEERFFKPALEPLLGSPRLWNLLCDDGWLRKELALTRKQVEEYVDDFLKILETRLTDGAMAYLKPHSIEELCRIFDRKCLARKRMGNRGGAPEFTNDDDSEDEEATLPTSFLKPPALEAAIADAEAKAKEYGLSDGLPEDYKTFFRTTNGIYAHDRMNDNSEIFRPVECIGFGTYGGLEMEILPHGSLSSVDDINPLIDGWPPILDNCIELGAGGDEGTACLFGPGMIQEAIARFDEIYAKASASDRVKYERAARDLYGGIEELRKSRSVIVRMFHWAAEYEAFNSFRALLEVTVADMFEDGDDEVHVRGDEDQEDMTSDGEGEAEEETPADAVKKRRRGGNGEPSKRKKPTTV